MPKKNKIMKTYASRGLRLSEIKKAKKGKASTETTPIGDFSDCVNSTSRHQCSESPKEKSTMIANDDNEFDKLNVSSESEKNQKSFRVDGRRIIKLGEFFTNLKDIASHGPLNCGLGCVDIIGEKQMGLTSNFTLQCKLCNKFFYVQSDSPDEFSINDCAVAGMIAIGGGLSQLQELCATLDLPIMTAKVYKKCHEIISMKVEKNSFDSMSQAAQKEREIAISEGRVDKDGTPIIDVIVDGCWSKRTYKKNYSALSGAAAIIGRKTGEILFLGVRNKYCCICAQSEKKGLESKTHKCYKNFSGPSTGMESDILLEGFKCSISMHGLIYGRMISDGDSNTYAKILKNRPYEHVTVEKIECRNHVLRNLCNKLIQLQTDTKYPLRYRKQLTQNKVMILRRTIRKIIQIYKTDSESEKRSNIEPLYNDLLLAHLHAFGDHTRCNVSFCSDKDMKNSSHVKSDTIDKSFFTSNLWGKICLIMSNVAALAPSLIHDVDSNVVEQFNSIVAKLVGGKRINFSRRGSYQTRCHAAVLTFNSHKMMSSLYKSVQGRSPRGKIKLFEQRRLKRINIMKKFYRKKNRRLFSKGNDTNYGEKCEKPDLPSDIFEKKKTTFLESLNRTDEEKHRIQKETVLQSMCSEWMEIRRTILTASNFGKVIKRREDVSCANLVKDILYKDTLYHVASIKHGRENEKKAIEQLKLQESIDVQPCGLFIDKYLPFLGASPDGIINGDMILEIKCPITAFRKGINQAITEGKLSFYKQNKNGVIQINKKHNWYYQIQGQLHITNMNKCLLGIWYNENEPVKTEVIIKDDSFWENEMQNKLKKFYLDCILPELIDPRYPRNMPMRDPEYIEEAIKNKAMKVKAKKNKAELKRKSENINSPLNSETIHSYGKKRRESEDENASENQTGTKLNFDNDVLSNSRKRIENNNKEDKEVRDITKSKYLCDLNIDYKELNSETIPSYGKKRRESEDENASENQTDTKLYFDYDILSNSRKKIENNNKEDKEVRDITKSKYLCDLNIDYKELCRRVCTEDEDENRTEEEYDVVISKRQLYFNEF